MKLPSTFSYSYSSILGTCRKVFLFCFDGPKATCHAHIWLYILAFSTLHFEPWEVEATSPSRTKGLGEVKSRPCESSRLNSRIFSKIRVFCLSHVDSSPNFDPSVQLGSEAGGLAALRRQSKEAGPVFQGCFARMRGCDKGRSLLRCVHVTSQVRGTISGFPGKVSDWPILSRATTDWIAKQRQQDHPPRCCGSRRAQLLGSSSSCACRQKWPGWELESRVWAKTRCVELMFCRDRGVAWWCID